MNNSTAICNVNSTYRSHPCRFDKGGGKKYAFQQSEQTPPHRHFKGHLSVSWKSCHSTYHTGAHRRVAKIIFYFSFLFSFFFLSHTCTHQYTHTHTLFPLSHYSRYICNRLTCDLQSEGVKKRETYSLRWVYSLLALQMHQICYRKCDQGQAWMPLRVIVEGTRCRWQLKGDTDNSYLSITVLLTHLKPETCGLYA